LLRCTVLLVKELSRLHNALMHHVVVPHEGVDLCDRQVNQHTSDLGREVRATKALHEREDARANVLLVVGVLSQDSRKDRHRLGQIVLRYLVLDGRVLGLNHWGLRLLRHSRGHGLSLRHGILRHVLVHLTRLVVAHLVTHLLVLLTLLVVITAHLLSGELTLMTLLTVMAGTAHRVTAGLSTHLALMATNALAAEVASVSTVTALRGLVHALEVALLEQETQKVHDLVRVLHLVEAAGVLSLVALEVLLVLLHLILHVAILLNLVVVNVQRVVVDVVSRKLGLSITGLVGGLEAHECERLLLLLLGEELKRLDVAVLAEELGERLLVHGGGEALHVEIATLL